MTRNEIERALRKAGFKEELRKRHVIYRLGEFRVTLGRGLGVDPIFLKNVKKILRCCSQLREGL